MTTDYAALTDAELNAVAAKKVMGWMLRKVSTQYGIGFPTKDILKPERIPNYTTDYNHAAQLRAECERRGLWREFVDCLMFLCSPDTEIGVWKEYWDMVSATPRQITIAAIKAVEGKTK